MFSDSKDKLIDGVLWPDLGLGETGESNVIARECPLDFPIFDDVTEGVSPDDVTAGDPPDDVTGGVFLEVGGVLTGDSSLTAAHRTNLLCMFI